MQVLTIKKINEKVYYQQLSNGLDVYFYTKEDSKNNYATLTTKFGSMYKEFIPINKDKYLKVPNGIAHFLEHKLFAQEDGLDPALFFEKTGTNYNAHTSLKNTTYEISGPNNFINNVCFLLDYVQSPYFTLENVEQEKGIIKEEIKMCNDNPWNILYDKIRYNSFSNDPIRDSIAGEIQDIDKIDKDLLYECYNTFYHPSNMFLVITGNYNIDEMLKAINIQEEKKKYLPKQEIKKKSYTEKKEVWNEYEVINFDTDVAKFAYSIKISIPNLKKISKKEYLIMVHLLFHILFSDTSVLDYQLKNKGIITNSILIDSVNTSDYLLISLINETDKCDQLLDKIKETLKDIKISEEDFKRKKKVLISNEIFAIDDMVTFNDLIVDNILFDNQIGIDDMEVVSNIKYETFMEVIKEINLNNSSCVIVKNKGK